MKALKWIVILLVVYAGIVTLFESLLGYFQPANESTLSITTFDADGQSHTRVLARIELDGKLFVAANHWPRGWYNEARANPAVEATVDGRRGSYTAVPVTDSEHDTVNNARPLGLGFRLLTGFPPRYFLRLDPPVSDRLPAITDDPGQARRDLLEHGLCLVGGLLSTDTVSDIRTALYRAAKQDEARGVRQKGFGLDYGDGNHQVWNVLSRDPVFVQLVQHPVALTLVRDTLGWPALLGNFSANIALPGSDGGALHADQVFVPEPWCDEPQGCNIAWCVDDFTACNGATRVVPGSHRLGRNHRPEDGDHSVPLIAPAGTMVALQSRLWHRTGNNESDKPRAALFAWYSRTIYRTQENWFLSLSPWVLENASDELLTLLAYRTEGFGLVNGHSPR